MIKKGLLFLALAIFISSCSIQKSTMTTNASLQSGNFKIAGIAQGSAGTFYFFMLGGLSKEGLLFKAKQNLYDNAKLKDNQALANITIDNIWTYAFPLFIRHDVYLSGDIIQFKDSGVGGKVDMIQK